MGDADGGGASDQLKPEFMFQPAQQMFADDFSLLPRRPHVYLPNCPMMQQEGRRLLARRLSFRFALQFSSSAVQRYRLCVAAGPERLHHALPGRRPGPSREGRRQ